MPNACTDFLSNQDNVAQSAKLTYRGSQTYGTRLGGICSLIVKFLIFGYLFISIVSLLYKPKYN